MDNPASLDYRSGAFDDFVRPKSRAPRFGKPARSSRRPGRTLTLLNRTYIADRLEDLRHRLLDYPLDEIPVSRPRVIDRFETASPIPRVLVQTYRTTRVGQPISSAVTRWQEMNPEFDYLFFDDDAARGFLAEYFPAEVLHAFDSLIPGAFRADLWRYCYLVEKGGVYVDIRMEPLLALRTMLNLSASHPPSFVTARDRPKKAGDGFIYNAFIAAAPGHPFLVAAIERALASISREDYGRNSLDITGPGCLGAAINGQLERSFDSPFGLGDFESEKVGRYRLLNHEQDPYHRSMLSMDGRPCVRTKCIHGPMSKADSAFPQTNYGELWRRRKVFR